MTGYKVEIRNYADVEITDYIIEETYYFLNVDKARAKADELYLEYLNEDDEYEVALEEIKIIE